MPHMRFVFLGPEVRLQLPSDNTSRRSPLLFGLEFPSLRPPGDFHLQVTSRFGFPYRFPSYVHHARSFAPCPAHVGAPFRVHDLTVVKSTDLVVNLIQGDRYDAGS